MLQVVTHMVVLIGVLVKAKARKQEKRQRSDMGLLFVNDCDCTRHEPLVVWQGHVSLSVHSSCSLSSSRNVWIIPATRM